VFIKQDAGFEFAILANQNSRNSAIAERVCCNEILRVCREVVLLTAAETKFMNCGNELKKLSFADNQFRGSFAAIKNRAGASSPECGRISYRVIDIE
jgi:hypothetical protein